MCGVQSLPAAVTARSLKAVRVVHVRMLLSLPCSVATQQCVGALKRQPSLMRVTRLIDFVSVSNVEYLR